ncbi:hypothetical protein A0H81_00137 [Grifola frondosa]|uniref:Uncharacterized protein n=1 Tax=Grifola frondosa TaxID=5627 RepID=A0A1C7MQJ1_GRIFR|nr:hypothetical protein A0H81_00137 [Grifola frondosa]
MKNGVPSLPRTDRKNKGRVGIDLTLYDAVALKDEVALEVAVSVLEDTLEFNSVSIDQLVEDLTSIPHLFEFMLSGKQFLQIDSEKTHLTNRHSSCSASKLLRQFSAYLFFLSYPPLTEPPNIKDCRRAVDLAVPALKELSSISFTEVPASRKKRSTKRASMNIAVDRKPFEALGVDTPCTKEEADRLVTKVLEDQKGVLQSYFEIFRMSALAETFKYAYIPRFPAGKSHSVSESVHASGHDMRTAYPMVQPMKAAQYFDNVAHFGQWRILVSDRANRFLRQTRKRERKLFDIIIKKIGELSNGHFSSDNQKKVAGFDTAAVPIFEAKMSRDARLIYQVDCVMDFDNVFRQAIRIYGVYTHTQLSRLSSFWETLGRELGKRGGLYRERCLRRLSLATDSNVFLPESFPVRLNTIDVDTSPAALTMPTDNDDFELGELLVLHKYVTLSQALLNSILNDQDSAYLFDMSSQEKMIIEHPTSCYVIGRSGTGKTTTMMYKMLGIHRAWETFHGSMPKPRQLFMTQSRVLANKVQGYFVQLQTSTAGKQDTAYATEQSQQAQIMYDQDEEFLRQNLLPRRFGELKDEHFPMFITFDHVGHVVYSASGNVSEYVENSDNIDYMQQNRLSFVSLNVFVNSYWRHFPEHLRKGLDPTMSYALPGVIKGSERALEYEDKYLDQSTYLGFSNRSQGTFVGQRENIYALFQAYLTRKRERREYDAADR